MFDERVQTRRDQQREQTRARIVETAQRLFVSEGFQATTIRKIAQAAAVSVGSVMAVGDKDSLLLMTFDRWIGAVHAQRAAEEPRPIGSPVQAVGEAVQPFLDLFSANPGLSREYGAILARGAHRTEVFGALATTLKGEFEQIARVARPDEAAPAAARALYYGYLGLLRAASASGQDPQIVRAGLEDIAATVLRTD
ncbi:TetR/AcrR family transcriptional regulator [Gordonia sp. MP11Mi]